MAAPTTPDNAPRRVFMNRSVTAPIRTSPATAKPPPEIGATEGVETLYTHPNASIVKFTTLGSRPSSSSPGRQQGGPQILLPWTSTTEQRVAVGPLSVYRVPGSVSFLNSGSLLHAILPRSQCWCVDGLSKFALRVLPDTYYRIELPGETEEDKEEVERLKVTLQKVCFYERTPCPFERGFDVEIEDEADLEVRRRRRREDVGPAKRWTLDRSRSWKPEGWEHDARRGSGDEASRAGSSAGSGDESDEVSGREGSRGEHKAEELASRVEKMKVTTPSRVGKARMLLEQRSVTAPASQLTLQSPPPSRLRTRVDVDGTVEVAEPTTVEGANEQQTERLRTFQAIPTDMPPSPPDSSAGLDHGEIRQQDSSEQSAEPAQDIVRAEGLEAEGQDEETTEGADEEEEDETVIIHEVESEADQPDNESEDDNAKPQQDMPLRLQPATPTADTQEPAAPQVAQDISTTEPEQRPATPPQNPTIPERRQSDPFTTNTPTSSEVRPSSSRSPSPSKPPSHPDNDPFAAIQARILARRSIGGTTSGFHPSQPPPTRQSTSSSSSNATVSSSLSRRSNSSSRQQQAFIATAMVRKACCVFLGPPAHLVAIMLKIAARFAKGAFGVDSMFYVESPAGSKGRVPGSYRVFDDGDVDGDEEGEDDGELEEWEEDDFGVPLRSPVRLASMSSLRGGSGSGSVEGLRERESGGRGWDVD